MLIHNTFSAPVPSEQNTRADTHTHTHTHDHILTENTTDRLFKTQPNPC